ncbi:hypothetical protein RB195_004901 [Necator americanus]|uniref:Uncharacterized protein n=1 Tax=Necator americanus TaxID=51031 RepID=A0ABR1BNK5_NECAM
MWQSQRLSINQSLRSGLNRNQYGSEEDHMEETGWIRESVSIPDSDSFIKSIKILQVDTFIGNAKQQGGEGNIIVITI